MPREDWIDREERRREDDARERRQADDFGQADYSTDYAYDPERRAGYRADAGPGSRHVRDDYDRAAYDRPAVDRYERAYGPQERRYGESDRDYARRMDAGDYRRGDVHSEEGRSWTQRAGAFFSGGAARSEDRRRRGPSDRVLWAVISERLEDERRLDLSDVDVLVENGEVTLNGTVRRKEDKRRIEDIADIDGVDHVQNNLRLRHRDRGWTFI